MDWGRPRGRSLGVPVGGAADRFALAVGNALVGSPPDAAALEVNVAGPSLRADGSLACVVFGAPFEVSVDGRPRAAGKTFTLNAGEVLRVGGTRAGVRAYLCVAGGLQPGPVLGSRSALEPLRAGARLECLPGVIGGRSVVPDWEWDREPKLLRALDGPQAGWFGANDFYPQAFVVTPASNRMGLRLRGEPLRAPPREMVSEPVCPGAVQVTRDGQCIVLGVDGQTIGGYPKVAQVIAADVDKLAQQRPGDVVRFRRVTLEEAEEVYRRKRAELREWLTRLEVAERFAPPG